MKLYYNFNSIDPKQRPRSNPKGISKEIYFLLLIKIRTEKNKHEQIKKKHKNDRKIKLTASITIKVAMISIAKLFCKN